MAAGLAVQHGGADRQPAVATYPAVASRTTAPQALASSSAEWSSSPSAASTVVDGGRAQSGIVAASAAAPQRPNAWEEPPTAVDTPASDDWEDGPTETDAHTAATLETLEALGELAQHRNESVAAPRPVAQALSADRIELGEADLEQWEEAAETLIDKLVSEEIELVDESRVGWSAAGETLIETAHVSWDDPTDAVIEVDEQALRGSPQPTVGPAWNAAAVRGVSRHWPAERPEPTRLDRQTKPYRAIA